MPALAPKAMPLLDANVMVSVASNVPPLSTKDPAVAEPGTAPRLLSAEIDRTPAPTVVTPE